MQVVEMKTVVVMMVMVQTSVPVLRVAPPTSPTHLSNSPWLLLLVPPAGLILGPSTYFHSGQVQEPQEYILTNGSSFECFFCSSC